MDLTDILFTVLWAMTPVGELRVAIPLAIKTYDMVWYQAFGWALLGNMVPVVILLPGLNRASRLLTVFPSPLGRFVLWRAEQLRRGRQKAFERWGPLGLVPLVAIPLPLTGAWTGCLASWALGIPPRRAFLPIALGVLIAAVIVTALVELSVNFPFIGD